MGMFGKIVLGGATVATMSTGQVQAAENSTPMDNPNANPKEIVVNPQDSVTNSDNILDLSNEFIAKQFETQEVTTEQYKMQVPGTIEDFKETLSSPTNLTDDQQKHIDLWSDYIISNPQDPVSREAFVALKEATDEVANKWIKIDQYYQSVETAGSYDDLKSSKENLIKNMDAILKHETSEEIRKNIPEANIEYHKGRPPKDYASLRLNNQFLIIDYMEKNPDMIQEYVGLRDSNNEQSKEKAKRVEAMFYKTYGIDINQCNPQNLDNVRNNIIRENKLLDKDFKEDAYKYCLHHHLDMAFSQTESTIHNINDVYVNDKPFTIDGTVALNIRGYAAMVAENAKGKKLKKGDEKIIYNANHCPPDLRDARDAYYSACTVKLKQEMNKPKGAKNIQYCNTNGLPDNKATEYIKLLRLGEDYTITGQNEMTNSVRDSIADIEKQRPDLKHAREGYEISMNLQKENFADAMNRPAGENVTVYDRYGFTENASSNYFNNKGLSYAPVDKDASNYINLLRLGADYTISGQNQMTDNDRRTIEEIERKRPDLAIARKYYEEQRAKQQTQENTQQQQTTYFAQNTAMR